MSTFEAVDILLPMSYYRLLLSVQLICNCERKVSTYPSEEPLQDGTYES